MNKDDPFTSRLQSLWAQARAHRAPPQLWPAIAARLQARTRGGPWLAAASLVAGAAAYLALAALLQRRASAGDAALQPIVAAAVPDLAQTAAEPVAEHLLLHHLAALPPGSRR
jgi:hypothetical protein